MSLKRNILASYVSQAYVTLIGILILPMYLKYMGPEAYGLVGFFTMLQALFSLLDMGLTPTVARETARFRGGAIDALSYRRLLRVLQMFFLGIALLGGGAMAIFSNSIAVNWLNVEHLPLVHVQVSLQLMAVGVALRWMSGLYRGCISGSEKLVWLGVFNSFVATLRFVLVLPLLIWIDSSIVFFFSFQLFVAAVELSCLAVCAHRLFPHVSKNVKIGWSFDLLIYPIKSTLRFSLAIAFTSSVWIFVTQADKLVLSKILPLAEYGYFTLAVLAASGVTMISGPISSALLPRMSRLQAEGDSAGLISLYRSATQMIAAIALPACLVLVFFAEHVLWIWTDNPHTATQAAPILRLYALGYGFLALSSLPYYLQFAKGDLKLHLIGNVLFVVLLIPALVWATLHHGSIGAGYAWLSANAVYFFVWLPFVHRRFVRGLHWQWLVYDLAGIVLCCTLAASLLFWLIQWPNERLAAFSWVIFSGVILLVTGVFSSRLLRNRVLRVLLNRS